MAKITKTPAKPKRAYKRKKKVETPPISVSGVTPDGSIVMDAGALPPNFQNLSIRIGDKDYAVSMESIRCKLREIKDKFADRPVEDILAGVSNAVGEQVAEVAGYAKEQQIKEGIIGYIFEFFLKYFVTFFDKILARIVWVGEALLAIVCKFFYWLGGLIPVV